MVHPRYAVLLFGLLVARHEARAQRLGRIDFPTSGSAEAQQHFVTGVLFLHSFEYPSAVREFREAERLDSTFAMAYWGEAMTYTHAVWNEQDAGAARAALRRLGPNPAARVARAPTPREKAYLRAVEILYGDGSKAHRDTAYADAMATVARDWPNDDDAQLFYALALLGLNQGDRDIPTYQRAGAIAARVFARNPEHPGAAHYVIHAYDDPAHAQRGLDAARAYSRIAPDAPHALHMTSHIFLALGLWDDVVAANESAVHAIHAASERRGAPPRACGHYPEWLEYGYLQQGRVKDAQRVLEQCRSSPSAAGSPDNIEGLAGMRAAFIVDNRAWTGALIDEPAARSAEAKVYTAFGTGFAAAMRKDKASATRALDVLRSASGTVAADIRPYAQIMALELRGLIQSLDGDLPGALASIRTAARMDDSLPIPFGPPLAVKTPHELAGEILLSQGRADEARTELKLALARTPRRPAVLLALARAETAAGRREEAASLYRTLAEIWRNADNDLPDLAEVRRAASGGTRRQGIR